MFSWWLCGTYTVTFHQDLKKRYHLKVKKNPFIAHFLLSLVHLIICTQNSCHPKFVTLVREQKTDAQVHLLWHSVWILILVQCNSYFFCSVHFLILVWCLIEFLLFWILVTTPQSGGSDIHFREILKIKIKSSSIKKVHIALYCFTWYCPVSTFSIVGFITKLIISLVCSILSVHEKHKIVGCMRKNIISTRFKIM